MKKLLNNIGHWILPLGLYNILLKLYFLFKSNRAKGKKGIKESLRTRVIRNTEGLKGIHVGKRCFILGGGSSIKEQDLTKLQSEFVISVSNTYVHKDFLNINPTYHVLPSIFKSHGFLFSSEKYVEWLRDMDNKLVDANLIMHIDDKDQVDQNEIFLNRNIYWFDHYDWDENLPIETVDLRSIPIVWSVSEVAISAALYMGFEKIYLLGFDHDWFNGRLVYFYDHTKEHILKPSEGDVSFADSEFQMRRHAFIFRKYKNLYNIKRNIYNANANPNSYVDVFPKVRYEDLF